MRERRLLLISYHFPPSTAAGALRWEKLAQHAARRGYGLDVVTQDPAELTERDDRRREALPVGTRITGVASPTVWTTRAEATLSRWLARRRLSGGNGPRHPPSGIARAASLSPDAIRWSLAPRALLRGWWSTENWHRERAWALAAASAAGRLVDPERHVAILTSGPPHAAHRAAVGLAARAGLPLILDFRDPWSFPRRVPEHFASPMHFALAARAERRAIREAALVLANTDALRDALRAAFPARAEDIITVMNGFDEDGAASPPSRAADRFTVTYAGALYLDRDPRLFLRAAGRVVRELGLDPERFGIELLGTGETFGRASLRDIAGEEGVGEHLTIHARLPHAEVLAFLAGSTMLLNLPQDSPFAIPSKVFEYLQFPVWLLALAAPGTPTANLLRGTGADLVAPGDVDAMTAVLRRRVNAFLAGERPGRIAGADRFSRAAQATVFLDALEEVLRRAPARR